MLQGKYASPHPHKKCIRKYFERVSDLSTRCVALHVLPCGLRCADLSAVLCTSSQVFRVLQLVSFCCRWWWFCWTAIGSSVCCVMWTCCLSGDSRQPQSVQILCLTMCGLAVLVVIPDNRNHYRFCVLHCLDFICDSVLLQPAILPCRALTGLFVFGGDSVKQ